MREIYYASSAWCDVDDHAFESYDDCENFTKERLISKIGQEEIDDREDEEPGWLFYQYDIRSMQFHHEGQS